jgi:hypothetical protein
MDNEIKIRSINLDKIEIQLGKEHKKKKKRDEESEP